MTQSLASPRPSRVKLWIVLMMICAVGCVAVLSTHRPGTRIAILHDYWSQTRVDTVAAASSVDAARNGPRINIPSGQYTTTDRINLGDRNLKSRFDLTLSDDGTFVATRTTTIGRDQDDRVTVEGRYKVEGGVIAFTPQQGPVGLYPVDGSSVVTLQDDGSMALAAGDLSIVLRRAPVR